MMPSPVLMSMLGRNEVRQKGVPSAPNRAAVIPGDEELPSGHANAGV